MNDHILTRIQHRTGMLTLNRPQALNSLSLEMVRAMTRALLDWRDDDAIKAVFIHSNSEKAFCAGGDIRFFYQSGQATPQQGSALIEDFFTEEYALNRLIHHYPKPYIVLMDGIVMGGGMGIAQCHSAGRLRIVTERSKLAMPEVNIGLFPDVGGSYFLSRAPAQIGTWLALTANPVGAADALHAGLADVFIPAERLADLHALAGTGDGNDIDQDVRHFAAQFSAGDTGELARQRDAIDHHFSFDDVPSIMDSLAGDASAFAQTTLATMQKRSPLMLCVTLRQLRAGAGMTFEECLRMERSMMRHCFKQGEAFEGIRAAVIDKDLCPAWGSPSPQAVSAEMVAGFFQPAWPAHAHPLRTWL
ncbi:enoyl-CoA hydratase/isomerase family protein [Janthinobacterium sp. 17J80-10]|uniref:enoyl-CoA hydratase/isomerase family protein n=1 Tax=Janthinobacterium sp. 17J80-10 TaxID=2497863 RepID=UPI0010059EDF|nr:enoyl-CoA hydratase/isomerase family protein [Janthinobacterium sp. 17J80-10]QAU35852.1 enoyl-CoA hydratase/isomerase family protein [Janthinobacterium sp. 17J80-10]